MRSTAHQTPFNAGATSVKERDDTPNPYARGSIEHRNFELGRAHALRSRANGVREVYLQRPTSAKR